MLIGLANKLCDTMGFMDTSDFSNYAQLELHFVLSFGIKVCGGSSIYISWIVLTKDCCNLYSSSQSIVDFFLIGSLFLNTYSLVTFS